MNAAAEAPAKRYRYTGMERDEESGLSYHKARYFGVSHSRWVSTDPIGMHGGLNLYAYGACRPSILLDQTGHDPETNYYFGKRVEGYVKELLRSENFDFEEQSPYPRSHSITDFNLYIKSEDRADLTIEVKGRHIKTYLNNEGSLDPEKVRKMFEKDYNQVRKHMDATGVTELVLYFIAGSEGRYGRQIQEMQDLLKLLAQGQREAPGAQPDFWIMPMSGLWDRVKEVRSQREMTTESGPDVLPNIPARPPVEINLLPHPIAPADNSVNLEVYPITSAPDNYGVMPHPAAEETGPNVMVHPVFAPPPPVMMRSPYPDDRRSSPVPPSPIAIALLATALLVAGALIPDPAEEVLTVPLFLQSWRAFLNPALAF